MIKLPTILRTAQAFVFCVTLLAGGRALAETTPARTILHCGGIVDPAVSSERLPDRSIVVKDGWIIGIEEGHRTPEEGEVVLDLSYATCLPGLIDAHTHIGMNYYDRDAHSVRIRSTRADLALRAVAYARTTLLAGFTTVRDVGAWEGEDLALKGAIERGDVVGPRMLVAAHPISATGGHADHLAGFREDLVGVLGPEQGVADGVPAVIHATRIMIRRGADLIKIMATGGILSLADDGTAPQLSLEEMQAIVETARDHGLQVAAHAHGDEGARRAVLAGVRSIEHGTWLSQSTYELMNERGVFLVPTVIAGKIISKQATEAGYYSPNVAEKARSIGPLMEDGLRRALRAGVRIAFGSDAGAIPHGQNAQEFVYMVEAGMTPLDAIASATMHAAELLDRKDVGTLAAGGRADIIAVTGNPLDAVSALLDVDFVMKDGVVYKHD